MIKLNTEFDLKQKFNIEQVIKRLELLLSNWGKLASADDHSTVELVDASGTLWGIKVDCGLCAEAGLQRLPDLDEEYYIQDGEHTMTLRYRMFKAFHTCDPDVNEHGYIFGEEEYCEEYYGNKFSNPLRKELAEHCVAYLKEFIDV